MVWIIPLIGLMIGFLVFRNYPLAFACLPVFLVASALLIVFIGDQSESPVELIAMKDDATEKHKIKNTEKSEAKLKPDIKWKVDYYTDPASGKRSVNALAVTSNNGNCTLSIKFISVGARYTDIGCQRITIKPYHDLEIRFNNSTEKYSMDLYSHGAGKGVFITEQQMPLAGHLDYGKFLSLLFKASTLAVTSKSLLGKWIVFTLPPTPIEDLVLHNAPDEIKYKNPHPK